MIQLSVVIITRDEERNIARCIESVRAIADEILVVDSHSQDATERICRSLGARFVQHAWPGYAEQKNYTNALAAHDYILSIDADEALSAELRDSIRRLKTDWTHDGYEMNRLTNYCGHWIRHGSWYPDRKRRLFDRRKGRWVGGRIHETVEMQAGARVALARGDLLHYSFPSIADHVRQVNHFTDLTAEAAHARGRKAGVLEVLFMPLFKFLRDYVFKLGFLDGYYGFVVCRISAHATFLKYVKLRRLSQLSQQEPSAGP